MFASLAEKCPYLLKEWSTEKNKDMNPDKVSWGTAKKAWWHCSHGHEWEASINSRTKLKTNCPYCAGQRATIETCIATTNPELLDEWDYQKNNDIKVTPYTVTRMSDKRIWWICKKDNTHTWNTQVKVRTMGSGCPYCAGLLPTKETSLATVYPEIAKELHPTKNGEITADMLLPQSNKKVWWLGKCGHEWDSSVSNRDKGKGCPYCINKRIAPENSLAAKFPEISRQWNYEKNGKLTPFTVAPAAGKKIWWICEKGHEWRVSIDSRTKDASSGKCPFCIGRKVSTDNCLAVIRPDLVKEWHPELNGKFTPYDFTSGSSKAIWWKCERGHEWKAQIANRTNIDNLNGCPICNGEIGTSFPEQAIYHYLCKIFNQVYSRYKIERLKNLEVDIYIKDLNLAIEYDGYIYHKSKNSIAKDERKNLLLKENNYKLLRIRENQPDKVDKLPIINASDSSIINYNANNGYMNLGECLTDIFSFINNTFQLNDRIKEKIKNISIDIQNDKLKIISIYKMKMRENSLAALYPEIARQWNTEKNHGMNPGMFTPNSNIKVWWKCEKGHEWEAAVSSRLRSGCPYCSGKKVNMENCLATNKPEFAKQWNYMKNGELTPLNVTAHSGKKAWWVCEKGHEWETSISSRVGNNTGCPYCSGFYFTEEKSLKSMYKDIAEEWDYDKNGDIKPDKISYGNNYKAHWKCKKGHTWQASVNIRTSQNTQCPYCCNQKICEDNCLHTLRHDLMNEWDYNKNEISPKEVGAGTKKRAWWICSKCGHSWNTAISTRTRLNSGCPKCN